MKTAAKFALIFALLAPCSAQVADKVVDKMVAVVNRQVILQSEWDEAARVQFLQQGKPLEQLTSQEMDAVLDRLIDQCLVQQQIVNNSVVEPTEDEIASNLRDIRSRIPGAATDEKWQAILAAYGVTEQDVVLRMVSQLRIFKFIDLRFRALARVDRSTISNYYQQTLLPELRKRGAPEPPLSRVSDQIQEILTEQGMAELQSAWIKELRSQAEIEIMTAPLNASTGAKP